MAKPGYVTIKVAHQDVLKIKAEAGELGMSMSPYVVALLRNWWQDPRPLKVLPPPVVNPWVPTRKLDMSGREIGSEKEEK